jgi:hypothetical protein
MLLMAAVDVVFYLLFSQLFNHIKISHHIPECHHTRRGDAVHWQTIINFP